MRAQSLLEGKHLHLQHASVNLNQKIALLWLLCVCLSSQYANHLVFADALYRFVTERQWRFSWFVFCRTAAVALVFCCQCFKCCNSSVPFYNKRKETKKKKKSSVIIKLFIKEVVTFVCEEDPNNFKMIQNT